ncbi:hypothetical protein CPJCM30710_31660 [Clostridium polyendosporum]|uniref:YfjL-like N-terminal domain-containing protein n=1 Tax=Clostridium polyendosporum TaxID=69208 RepID=A0A919S1F9_9CLOT|nr:hypothetical protein [Clostridium polyendosporum]GIM30500.1 hypothetical protein CPJCM30710_31660 [Clostridium polyendosporum]
MGNKRCRWVLVLALILAILLNAFVIYLSERGNPIARYKVNKIIVDYVDELYGQEHFKVTEIKYNYGEYIVHLVSTSNRFKQFSAIITDGADYKIVKDEYKENPKRINNNAEAARLINEDLEDIFKNKIVQLDRLDIYIFGETEKYDDVQVLVKDIKTKTDVFAQINVIIKGKNIAERAFVQKILDVKSDSSIMEYSQNSMFLFYYYPKYVVTELDGNNILSYPYYSVGPIKNSNNWTIEELLDDSTNWKWTTRYLPSAILIISVIVVYTLYRKKY